MMMELHNGKDTQETLVLLPSSSSSNGMFDEDEEDEFTVKEDGTIRDETKNPKSKSHFIELFKPSFTQEMRREPGWFIMWQRVLVLLIVMLLLTIIFFLGALVTNRRSMRAEIVSLKLSNLQESMDVRIQRFRRRIAVTSLQLLQEDMMEEGNHTPIVDIGQFRNDINDALDALGFLGVYGRLFDTIPFLDTLHKVAYNDLGLHNLRMEYVYQQQPTIKYFNVPNKGEKHGIEDCTGCFWWLLHWTGSITAEKMLQDGYIIYDPLVDSTLTSSLDFVNALHKLEQEPILDGEFVDIMPFHSIHGFTWQYIVMTGEAWKEYPADLAMSFCGSLSKDAASVALQQNSVNTNTYRECWHGFGHSLYVSMATKELGIDVKNMTSSIQLRPHSGFQISNDVYCQAMSICEGATPKVLNGDKTPREECRGAFRHSDTLFQTAMSSDDAEKRIRDRNTQCKKKP